MKKYTDIFLWYFLHYGQWAALFCSVLILVFVIFWWKSDLLWSQSTSFDGNISFVVDVSKSMLSEDISSWNGENSRLSTAEETIQYILSELPNFSYGLSVFAGEALRILPFTQDKDIFLTFLSGISSESVSVQWTDLSKALVAWIEAFTLDEAKKWWTLVLFTDGWDEVVDSSTLGEIKKLLRQKHIELLVVGVGSEEGSYIPVGTDAFGEPVYKMYNWQRVVSKLDASGLRNLASSLWWTYTQVWSSSDEKKILSFLKGNRGNSSPSLSYGNTSSVLPQVMLSFLFFCVFVWFYLVAWRVWVRKR